MPDRSVRVVVPNQPAFATAVPGSNYDSPMQREREEATPHFISYSIVQRTAGRTGKR
jgi:hypothetical protein